MLASVPGFRENFYGFFIFAVVWVVLYFVLASYLNRRDRS
jgi:hypothetical protein